MRRFCWCQAHPVGKDVRVLLVSDSRDEREMYAECFRRKGYCTLQAATASDGLRLATELAPDIVVTDIKLPGEMDGLDLTETLKQDHIQAGPACCDPDWVRIRTGSRTGESGWLRSLLDQTVPSGGARDEHRGSVARIPIPRCQADRNRGSMRCQQPNDVTCHAILSRVSRLGLS